MILFNEIEPFAASWMANQYTEATIDARSIRDLAPTDLAGFRRVHFFAGIGGWELALQLAGWPEDEEIWTGSCPCQPFSVAGKRGGTEDERHLWPEFFRLVKACRPRWAMGEQVSSKDGLAWLDGVFADLEAEGYTCWSVDTCAAGVGAPHIRQRLFWVAVAPETRHPRAGGGSPANRDRADSLPQRRIALAESAGSGEAHRMEHAASDGRDARRAESERGSIASGCEPERLGDAEQSRPQERDSAGAMATGGAGATALQAGFDSFRIIPCRDGKSRRVSSQSGDEPLAYGVPRRLGSELAGMGLLGVDAATAKRIVAVAGRNRVGRLRGYGNAIVIQAAAEFVKAVMET